MEIPKDVEKYLVQDEAVDNRFGFDDQIVYTSKNRLFLTKGNKVRDVSYVHISSIELETKPNWWLVIAGIIIVALTFIPWNGYGGSLGRLLTSYGTFSLFFTAGTIILGIFIFATGFKRKSHYILLNVAGMSEKLVLKGNKDDTSALFRLVNERRLQVIPNQTQKTSTSNTA